MTGQLLNLEAKRHESRVLGSWVASREGAAGRAGIQAMGENSTTTNITGDTLAGILGYASRSASGVSVTPDAAMRVSTVYACVSKLAGAIASLPFAVYERTENAQAPADHPYWWLLNEQANPDMTASTAWKMLISAQLFYGDGFAELIRPNFASAKIIGWRPIHPMRVQPFRSDDDQVYYRIQPRRGAAYVRHADDMIHLKSLGYDDDTLVSPSPITLAAREAIGISIAAEGYSAKFFADGATFDYALKTASAMDTQQLKDLKESLIARSAGSRTPLILSGGLEPAQLSVNSKDAEILATRLFGVEEICRIFGMPPHIVGHTEKNSSWGTGMAEQGGNFVRYALNDRLNDIKQEFNRKLWPIRQKYFVEHVTAALERGDLAARNEAYRISLGRAGEQSWQTINEIRRLENLPPIEGGDKLITAADMQAQNPADPETDNPPDTGAK